MALIYLYVSRVSGVLENVESTLSLLEAAVDGNVDDMSPHFLKLIPLLIWGMPSALVGERICHTFLKLRHAVFDMDDAVFG